MTQWNFKGNYLLCISFLLVADRFIYKLSKFAKSHSSLNILIVQMSDICIACGRLWGSASTACATHGSTVFVIQVSVILSFSFQLFICQTLFVYLSVRRLCVRISKAINIIGRYHPDNPNIKLTHARAKRNISLMIIICLSACPSVPASIYPFIYLSVRPNLTDYLYF